MTPLQTLFHCVCVTKFAVDASIKLRLSIDPQVDLGELTLGSKDPAVIAAFQPGKYYDVLITEHVSASASGA